MVAAQVQIGRVVTVSLDAGRMEYVVDAQQAFEVAVGVHIAATAGAEAVFEDIGQFGIGVGGWQGVEVTACQYGVGAGNYQLADAVRLFGAFHEYFFVGVQGNNIGVCKMIPAKTVNRPRNKVSGAEVGYFTSNPLLFVQIDVVFFVLAEIL